MPQSNPLIITIEQAAHGQRLDRALADALPDRSRSEIQRWIKEGRVLLHGEPAKAIASYVAGRGDTILAMVTRRQSAMETAFLGSVTAGCLRQAGVPVLMRAP